MDEQDVAAVKANITVSLTAGLIIWLKREAARRGTTVSKMLVEMIEAEQARTMVAA